MIDRSIDTRRAAVDGRRPAAYEVRRGDTLYAIAWRYGLDYRELARWNDIPSPYTIYPGQDLRLSAPPRRSAGATVRAAPESTPVRSRPTTAKTRPAEDRPATTGGAAATPTPAANRPSPAPSEPPGPKPTTGSPIKPARSTPAPAPAPTKPVTGAAVSGRGAVTFSWPASGAVLSSFASGDPSRNGIDIAGSAGQRVNAAAAGQVVYSGTGLVGYGELIIVKHNDEWLSAYGHNRKRLVAEGDMVTAGQQIAELGDSGTNRPKLHFEIRRNGKPVDPQRYLPGR